MSLAALIPTALQVLPGLLNSGGQSAPAPRPQVDVSGQVRAAVARAEDRFRSRLSEHSASTARVLNEYRATIRDLNARLARANQAGMQARLAVAQAQQQAAQNQQPVIQPVAQSKDNTMLYLGGGLLVMFVLMQSR